MLPANATDALVRASIVVRTARTGYTIVRAPERSDYWFANCLVLDNEPLPTAYERWIALHAAAFASVPVKRRVVVWEKTGRDGMPHYEGPIERERSTVFAVRSAPKRGTSIAEVREFDRAEHWDAALAIERQAWIADGKSDRLEFGAWRFGVYRADAARGRCRMWGAFCGDELVASAGLYANDAYGRFITPITKPAFRGRGLFGALAAVAVGETFRAHPRALVVIVATAGDDPERIYERLGFEAIGEQHALIAEIASR